MTPTKTAVIGSRVGTGGVNSSALHKVNEASMAIGSRERDLANSQKR